MQTLLHFKRIHETFVKVLFLQVLNFLAFIPNTSFVTECVLERTVDRLSMHYAGVNVRRDVTRCRQSTTSTAKLLWLLLSSFATHSHRRTTSLQNSCFGFLLLLRHPS